MVKPLDTLVNFYIDAYVLGFILIWYSPTFFVGLLDVQEHSKHNLCQS